ncbi:gluconate 2-dehydrogenase subunit 3 family protein [Emticicia sp. CRIBPO]|jgi:gluconate 2-dehydrogenase gamma chain|uniref:gluconate 2-dehydrogenase subunit 3 family protein n=1 Tax=Emticicia sp. CRIBPO TaxID=2683258 RepID=UPI0014131ECA|nr:gluconate 2-dehydrogenase subunit 3 family protein [Emticicia sp. CRIBPO]NBA86594.1 gluconate 2-dehydrogenase subunit 3 family protein [Emticicia sp. CRIBPO]
MKRRDILKNIGLGTAGVVVSGDLIGQTPVKKTEVKPIPDVAGGRLKEEIEHNNKLNAQRFFSAHELATVTILVDIIIPADKISGSASQAGVPAFIEFMAKDIPAQQTPLRGGLMWLDMESKKQFGQKFRSLTPANRLKLVDQIAYPSKAKPEMSQGVAFFNLMRNLTASGFFSSEMGIKDIGYAGNTPNQWDGVPKDVLAKYNLSYDEWSKHVNG